mmetsp:Transcript_97662/g.252723  ORF Transcript_97662/g.252723 Transcript_97662/m.252723 type:complete len:235 (+) Transcript_97662:226-930(+)
MSPSSLTATSSSSRRSAYFVSHVFCSSSSLSAVRASRSRSFAMTSISRSFRSVLSFWKVTCKELASFATMELLSSMSRMYCSLAWEKSLSTASTRSFSDVTAACRESSLSSSPASSLSCTVAICASNMPCSALFASTRRLISALSVFSRRAMLSLRAVACPSSESFRTLLSSSICRSKPENFSERSASLRLASPRTAIAARQLLAAGGGLGGGASMPMPRGRQRRGPGLRTAAT